MGTYATPSECEREMAGYPCLLSPFEHGLKYRSRIPRLRTHRLVIRRHQSVHRQLATPRLLATRLETAVTLPVLERRRQPIRRQRWERRVLADPTQHLRQGLGSLGTWPRWGQLLLGLGYEDPVAGQEPGQHQVAGRGRQRLEPGLLLGGQGQGGTGLPGRRVGRWAPVGRWAGRGYWNRTWGVRGGNKGRGIHLGVKFGLTASQPGAGITRRIGALINPSRGRHAARDGVLLSLGS